MPPVRESSIGAYCRQRPDDIFRTEAISTLENEKYRTQIDGRLLPLTIRGLTCVGRFMHCIK